MTHAAEIPNKLYFRIGEVSELIDVKPYVLRYWETEFPDIKPTKSKSGQRLYKRRDVELLFKIKSLLYEQGFTINGARQKLKDLMREDHPVAEVEADIPVEVIDDEEIEAVSHSPVVEKKVPSIAMASGEHRKILLKLREDLQKCLEDIRG